MYLCLVEIESRVGYWYRIRRGTDNAIQRCASVPTVHSVCHFLSLSSALNYANETDLFEGTPFPLCECPKVG